MRTRVFRLATPVVAALCALAYASPALARDRICTYYEGDVEVITNLCGGKHGGHHRGKLKADPELKNWVPGPTAPLEFTPSNASARYDTTIRKACALYHIPPALVRAIMNAESNFDPKAMSDRGAIGLMQLMPGTADTMAVSNISDPNENIMGGVRYLRELTNKFDGDMVKVVAAYNAGPNAVIAAGGVPEIPETQDYVRKVIRLYFKYKAEAGQQLETASAH